MDSTLPFSSYFFWALWFVCVCVCMRALRLVGACVHREYRGLCVGVCVWHLPLGAAGRCSSQTVGIEGRIKFGSACDSSLTGGEKPRIQSPLSLSLCSRLYWFYLNMVKLMQTCSSPWSQHVPIRCLSCRLKTSSWGLGAQYNTV